MNERSPKFSATLTFYAIFEKNKPVRVLPVFLNNRNMKMEEISNLPLKIVMSGRIRIPSSFEPWSKISEDADYLFLMIQSYNSWEKEISQETDLFSIESVRKLILMLEDSLNNHTWRKDLTTGKLHPRMQASESISPKLEEGVAPGQNWLS